jgi:hypothetical protein
VRKNCPYSDQIGRQINNQIRFLERLFGGGAAESYDGFLVLEVGGILDTSGAKLSNADVIGDLMIWTLEVSWIPPLPFWRSTLAILSG